MSFAWVDCEQSLRVCDYMFSHMLIEQRPQISNLQIPGFFTIPISLPRLCLFVLSMVSCSIVIADLIIVVVLMVVSLLFKCACFGDLGPLYHFMWYGGATTKCVSFTL